VSVLQRNLSAFVGALVLSFTFGSIHAFGVLLRPLEQTYGASRLFVSMGYSVALLALTVAVLAGPQVLSRLSASQMAFACGVAGFLGLGLAVVFGNVWSFIFGFGLLFGFGNGIAYLLFLDQAARALPDYQGLAIGGVTASYGCGAAVFAPVLALVIGHAGVEAALLLLATAAILSAIVAGLAFSRSQKIAAVPSQHAPSLPKAGVIRLWCVYFLAAMGSLMIVAHAEAILAAKGAAPTTANLAPSFFALGNIFGSLIGGPWAERRKPPAAFATPVALSLLCMAALTSGFGAAADLGALAGLGLAYGTVIVAILLVIRRSVPSDAFGHVFGRVFTAWGCAGLIGPLLGSTLNAWYAGYAAAIFVAAASAALALVLLGLRQKVPIIGQQRTGERDSYLSRTDST